MVQAAGCTILVVDDEPGILSALEGLLGRQGYTVTTAVNGALAWEHLQAKRYDVILVDIHMPEIDGTAFYAMLQQYYPSLCSRVVFLTGDTLGDTTKAFLEQGGQPYVYKPCGADEILHAIEQVLRTADNPPYPEIVRDTCDNSRQR